MISTKRQAKTWGEKRLARGERGKQTVKQTETGTGIEADKKSEMERPGQTSRKM